MTRIVVVIAGVGVGVMMMRSRFARQKVIGSLIVYCFALQTVRTFSNRWHCVRQRLAPTGSCQNLQHS